MTPAACRLGSARCQGLMRIRVYMEVTGCDRRRLDAESLRMYFEANGFEMVDDPNDADRIVMIACAFKEREEEESIRRLRSLQRYGRDILLYGCLADVGSARSAEFEDLPSVSPREIDTIDRYFEGIETPFAELPGANVIPPRSAPIVGARRRVEAGLVPWQELADRFRRPRSDRAHMSRGAARDMFNLFVCRGCLGACSYCAIRRAIGPVRSKPAPTIVAELLAGIESGYRRFRVLGDEPGCYGSDIGSSLPELLDVLALAADSAEVRRVTGDLDPLRFHIREIHPQRLIGYREELLGLARPAMIENILSPVQSGSDRILASMRREHTAAELLRTFRLIREALPNVALDTQIIAGFPSETDEDFQATLEFVRDVGFDSVVVFPYHDKQGTASSRLDGKIDAAEIRHRVRRAFRFFDRARIPAYHRCP